MPRLRTHPGEVLAEEYMKPLGLSANGLGQALGVPGNRISDIVRGRRDVSADTAIRLGRFFRRRSALLAEPSGGLRPFARRKRTRLLGRAPARRGGGVTRSGNAGLGGQPKAGSHLPLPSRPKVRARCARWTRRELVYQKL